MVLSSIRRIILTTTLILLTGVVVICKHFFYPLFYLPMVKGDALVSQMVQIPEATSAYSFVRILKQQGLISSTRPLLAWIRFRGMSKHLKAGIYELQVGETAIHFLARVTQGAVLTKVFKIIEGTTQAEISKNLISSTPFIHYHPEDWLAIQGIYPNGEGLLLADTYSYDAGSDARLLLQQAHLHLLQYLEKSWQERSPNLPYKNSYELLTAASILEKEAASVEEKRLISGVIVNRLRKNMPLQMDPTVIYALGSDYHGKLFRGHLHIESAYNTYKNRGLPPTPIAMVGKEAIDAAAHPLETKYLYFVAKGSGRHQFSVTYREQKKAIEQYLRNHL